MAQLQLRTKQQLAIIAEALAVSRDLVVYREVFFQPRAVTTTGEMAWFSLDFDDLIDMANSVAQVLFENPSQKGSFVTMLAQLSKKHKEEVPNVLLLDGDQLVELTPEGTLVPASGGFIPNFLQVPINRDEADKKEVFDCIKQWLNSEEDAHSLLYHIATALAPSWSAGKLVMLIGIGRNGKSTLLKMVDRLFGRLNISNVTRQQMAERSPVCHELNGKLLNIVYDADRTYLKDSSFEKTVIVGELASVRKLYANGLTPVITNSLFMEGLNLEPKSGDKSTALQKRLTRFTFPNVYPEDEAFVTHMTSDRMVGAFLALLLDHFVLRDEKATKLQPTTGSKIAQVEQTIINSPIHQYVLNLVSGDPDWIDKLNTGNADLDALITGFMAWRLSEGYGNLSSSDVLRMFKDEFHLSWASKRVNGKVTSVRKLEKPKPDMQLLLDSLKG